MAQELQETKNSTGLRFDVALGNPDLLSISFWPLRPARPKAAALAVRVLARGLQPGRERAQPPCPCDACNYGSDFPSRHTLASKAAALDRTTLSPPELTSSNAIPLYTPFTKT